MVHPSVPGRRNFLRGWEPAARVCKLNEAALILVFVIKVLVIAVAVFIDADEWRELISEASLLVRGTVGLASQNGSHKTLFAVKLPKLRAHHADGQTPRSHFY